MPRERSSVDFRGQALRTCGMYESEASNAAEPPIWGAREPDIGPSTGVALRVSVGDVLGEASSMRRHFGSRIESVAEMSCGFH